MRTILKHQKDAAHSSQQLCSTCVLSADSNPLQAEVQTLMDEDGGSSQQHGSCQCLVFIGKVACGTVAWRGAIADAFSPI